MESIARTNVQFFNQLLGQGRSESMLKCGDCSWITEFDVPNMPKMVQFSERLGYPQLGKMLADALQLQLDWMERVPKFLRTKDGLSHEISS